MNETVIGTISAGNTAVWEVVDLGDDFNIEIRTVDEPKEGIKIAKQSAHVLADILKRIAVK